MLLSFLSTKNQAERIKKMRIVAGKLRGKNLVAPDGKTTRPTSDRARESVFNVLDSKLRGGGVSWDSLTVADVFAGTGALGAEALSRGASELFAWELDAAAVRCFKQNLAAFEKIGAKVTLYPDALTPVPARSPVGLLFMDPPYERGLVAPALAALRAGGWIDGNTRCVVEIANGEKDVLPPEFEIVDARVYGKARVLFARLNG